MRASHSVWREGAVAGLLGAGTVALWFLVRDTLAGVPLRTASVLGQVLNSSVGKSVLRTAAVAVTGTLVRGVLGALLGGNKSSRGTTRRR